MRAAGNVMNETGGAQNETEVLGGEQTPTASGILEEQPSSGRRFLNHEPGHVDEVAPVEGGAVEGGDEKQKVFQDIDKRIKGFANELACGINESIQKKYGGGQNATQPVEGGM